MVVVWLSILVVVAVAVAAARPWLIRNGWLFGPGHDGRPMGTATANALGEIEALFQPAVGHILEWRHEEDAARLASRPVPTEDADPVPSFGTSPPPLPSDPHDHHQPDRIAGGRGSSPDR